MNQGAVGLIIARRVIEGRSGHVVAVLPESAGQGARRDSAGEVIAPVQSQAGERNFRRGTAKVDWFREERFAEFAFWVHA